jgi:hypothetical protein
MHSSGQSTSFLRPEIQLHRASNIRARSRECQSLSSLKPCIMQQLTTSRTNDPFQKRKRALDSYGYTVLDPGASRGSQQSRRNPQRRTKPQQRNKIKMKNKMFMVVGSCCQLLNQSTSSCLGLSGMETRLVMTLRRNILSTV